MAKTKRGFQTSRRSWEDPFRRHVAPAPQPVRTAEQRQRIEEHLNSFCKEMGWSEKDREARSAIEGDTDLNHDNVRKSNFELDTADLDRSRVHLANCIECRARIYEGDRHHVTPNNEFYCSEHAKVEAQP